MGFKVKAPSWVLDLYAKPQGDHVFIRGGIGSGKTRNGMLLFLLRLFQNSKVPLSWAVAPNHARVDDIIIPTFIDVAASMGMLANVHYKVIKARPRHIELLGINHTIVCHSADRPEFMVGANLANYFITEFGLQSRDVFNRCQDRARHSSAAAIQGIIEGVPEGMNHYAELANYEGFNPETNGYCVRLETQDNKHNPPGYLAKIIRTYQHDPQRLEAYTKGVFTSFTRGTAYWEFYQSRHVKDVPPPDPKLPIIFTWDFGVDPLACVAAQKTRHVGWDVIREKIRFHWEGSGRARGILDAVGEFIEAHPPSTYKETPIWVDGGHDGHSGNPQTGMTAYSMIVNLLRQKYSNVSVIAKTSAPQIETRLQHVAQAFAHDVIEIDPRLTTLIQGLTHTNLKPGTWELHKPRGGDRTHFPDAMCHPILGLWRPPDERGNPKEKKYGVTR